MSKICLQFTQNFVCGSAFSVELLQSRPGFISFSVDGKKAWSIFQNEGGGHRWQRIPPTEKRGRVQTSTITVAVLKGSQGSATIINPKDLDIKTCRGSGKGGQHRNVTDSAVQVTHLPSGISTRVENGRSQRANKEQAIEIIQSKLNKLHKKEQSNKKNATRKQQVGTGMRGDKIRTIRTQDDIVTNHITGGKCRYKKYARGDFGDLTK